MERGVMLLFLLYGVLSGGGALAAASNGLPSRGGMPARDAAGCDSSGFPMRGAANQLAATAACTHSNHTAHHLSSPTGATCDPPLFASELTKFCTLGMVAPGPFCCGAVLMTVERDMDCLCDVAEEPEFDVSDLSVAQVWHWYRSCNGRRRSVPQDKDRCEPGSAPPPSPPPPAPVKPEKPSASPLKVWFALGLLFLAGVACGIFVGLKLWLPRTVQAPAPAAEMIQSQAVDEGATGEPEVAYAEREFKLCVDEDSVSTYTVVQVTSHSGEEEMIPPQSPPRVEERRQLARAQLPPSLPFEPVLSSAPVSVPIPTPVLAA